MFGYLVPFKPMLRMGEYDAYKALYCGLCSSLGKEYGMVHKLTLSYDFVLMSLIGMSIKKQPPQKGSCRCMANPFLHKEIFADDEVQSYVTDCAIILNYYKVKDNLQDKGLKNKLLAALLYPFCKSAHKKAAQKHPELDRVMADAMDKQAKLEAEKCDSIDRAADPTSTFLARVLQGLATDEVSSRVLSRMGYLLGRYIYILDAADDFDDDSKKGNYNPFVIQYGGVKPADFAQNTEQVLQLTASEIAAAYQLLDIYHFGPILENMIYLGLAHTTKSKLYHSATNDSTH